MQTTTDIHVCQICRQPYYASKKRQHYNLHEKPTHLVPRTKPNVLKKQDHAKYILQDTTNASQISLRSIMPQQIPRPQQQKRIIQAPSHGTVSIPGEIKAIKGNKVEAVRDYLQLQSNIAGTELQQQDIKKLQIEKQINIRPTKKIITKKQLPNYQNANSGFRQTQVSRLTAQKKVAGKDRNQIPGAYLGQSNIQGSRVVSGIKPDQQKSIIQPYFVPQPVYEAKVIKQPERSNKTRVQIKKRQTQKPNEFKAIQTKSNIQEHAQNRPRTIRDEASDIQRDSYGQASPKNQVPLHPNQCPSCHGFYCQYCKATIPPKFRPFWDENEDPKLIQYYKERIQKQMDRRKKQGPQCVKCDQM